MGADVVEFLLPPEAVWFESAPSLAVGKAVIFGVDVIEGLLFDGGELVGFDGLVGCDVLKELATVSTSAFLSLALVAIVAWMEADRGESCASTLEKV